MRKAFILLLFAALAISIHGQAHKPDQNQKLSQKAGITEAQMDNILNLHGHMCAGVAIGIRVSQVALREMGQNTSQNELVALVETDKCPVDAVQMLMGTTAGRQNLVYEKKGKNVFSFVRRSDGKGIKITVKESKPDPEFTALREKKFSGKATKAELERFEVLMDARIKATLEAPEKDLLIIEPFSVDPSTIKRQ